MESFPKEPCLKNCSDKMDLICDDRGLKRPEGEKRAKAIIQCEDQCKEINKIYTIRHVSDQFVSALADSSCGGPKGSGQKKPGFYSVEIRGTDTGSTDSGNHSGTKARTIDSRLATAESIGRQIEMRRDARVWYQSFSDFLCGPTEPSRQKSDEFKSLLDAAKVQRANGDLEGAGDLVDEAIVSGFKADNEYDSYQRESLDHADTVKWVHLGVSALLVAVGGGTALGLALGGTTTAGASAVGGAEVISLAARIAARQGVQETLKRAAIILFGLEAARQGEQSDR